VSATPIANPGLVNMLVAASGCVCSTIPLIPLNPVPTCLLSTCLLACAHTDPAVVNTLVEMGFTQARVETALRRVGVNSVEAAMEWLLTHPEDPAPAAAAAAPGMTLWCMSVAVVSTCTGNLQSVPSWCEMPATTGNVLYWLFVYQCLRYQKCSCTKRYLCGCRPVLCRCRPRSTSWQCSCSPRPSSTTYRR
jgi:hypothetical protein